MPTRIDIELTSAGSDGSWTWRAAGARAPRGVLDGSILPAGAAVGDQLRAESEKDVEGIRILSIVPAKSKAERSDVLELLPSGEFDPVTQQRVGRSPNDPARQRPRRDRGDRDDRGRDGREGERPRRDRPAGGGERRGPRREGATDDREGRQERPRVHRPHFTPPPELPQRPKPKRLRPGKQHLAEVLASIPEEQRPVAELALQGMPAVRQRLKEDNARLRAAGKPEMPDATVLRMAEGLLPQLRVADWRDRAEAAQRQLAHLDLRDLRSVVAASDDPVVARDESTRSLASELKSSLAVKQEEELNLWLTDVEAAVDVGRVVRALRLSAMPPKAGVPFPANLGGKLVTATVAALGTDDPADRWIAVLEAAAFSPVRALVTPAAAPSQSSPELVLTVTRLAPLLPQVATLFAIEVPAKATAPKPLRPAPRKKEPARRQVPPPPSARRTRAVAAADVQENGAAPPPDDSEAAAPAPHDAADAAEPDTAEPDTTAVPDTTAEPDTAPQPDTVAPDATAEPDTAPEPGTTPEPETTAPPGETEPTTVEGAADEAEQAPAAVSGTAPPESE